MKTKITIYTDGSSRGNPGPGGYGVVLQSGPYYKELSAGYRLTTNNRMELLAVITALETVKVADADITVYSDSKYVIDSITKGWVFGWLRKGLKKKKNRDLWMRYLPLHKRFAPTYVWVKGHASVPLNERCDVLATTAADGHNLLTDEGYENETASGMEGLDV